MDTLVTREELEEMFDQTLREVTRQMGGISLSPDSSDVLGVLDGAPPEEAGEVYTVCAGFERGANSRLCLCADKSMFIRLTRHMMRQEEVTEQDVEDFSKEFFNVVCGHIAARLFRATKVASRFGVPKFCRGPCRQEEQREHLVLSYSGDQREGARLIHLLPVETPAGEWAGLRADQDSGGFVLE